ncbi:SpoIIE family protein phosphatase [Streptomyces sp. TRM66268-LWL]|uniref:SpoIIE family protein phosphatase n=1 Tax=Streptomyces polyasparticus TaxID=2767826 RepID=A0ABR7SWH1_9ACTN|nr:ATP-binding protein [Streptomyces polyasparticus]MBC9718947.1 SpoIIE family protein phosphatase [Streptomyces polyasparticus]
MTAHGLAATLVRMDHYSAVHLAANAARATAQSCGLSGALPERAAVLASELASNVVKHAKNGALYIQKPPDGTGVQVIAVDHGPGMADPALCMADGYTSTNSLGSGLGAVQRMASELTIRSRPGAGTLVCARLSVPGSTPVTTEPALGTLLLTAEGEQECGDGWAVQRNHDSRTFAVIDGLGHGKAASDASRTAVQAFLDAGDAPLLELLDCLHKALRRTRGAAVALLRLRPGSVEHCGVGNVRAALTTPDGTVRRMSPRPGVVGWNLPAPHVERMTAPAGSSVVAHTDGIDDAWARQPTPALLRLPAPLLAAALAHSHRLSRDDATILVSGTTRGT